MKISQVIITAVSTVFLLCGCSSSGEKTVELGEEYQKLEQYKLHGNDMVEPVPVLPETAVRSPERLKEVPQHWKKILGDERLKLLREYNLGQREVKGDPAEQDKNTRRLIVGIAVEGMKEEPVEPAVLTLGIRSSLRDQPQFRLMTRAELGKKSLSERRKYNLIRNAYEQRKKLNEQVIKLLTDCGGRPEDRYYEPELCRLHYELIGLTWKLYEETKVLKGMQ